MASVYDPEIVYHVRVDPPLAAGTKKLITVKELDADEVLEVYRVEVVPPITSTGSIQRIRYITLSVDGNELDTIHINSVMAPPSSVPGFPARAVDLGVPLLHRPLTVYTPSAAENTTVKVAATQKLGIVVIPEDDITEPFEVIIYTAYVKGASKLSEVAGPSYTVSLPELGVNRTVALSPSTWSQLPGGTGQPVPRIMPWITYARNKNPTTPNTPYDFTYPDNVEEPWMAIGYNLAREKFALYLKYLGVIPHANSKATRIYIHGRGDNPWHITRPLPEYNYYPPAAYYDMNINRQAHVPAGPRPVFPHIPPYWLLNGVKFSIQHVDNGSSIPANAVEVHVYGVKVSYV